MTAEFGQFSLCLALALAVVQAASGLLGAWRGSATGMALSRSAAGAQLLALLASYAALTWTFVVGDFSVTYVATNSNSALPLMYRISAVWGAHEGSILMWGVILGMWTFAVSALASALPRVVLARVLGVLGLISIGVLSFTVLTSNPFDRLLPAAAEGRDLNPLLQDPGMAIHPPLLYVGYVGLAVPFAFACAALLGGRLDSAWTRWTRPWTTVAWAFLTAGIALGSWWAYAELGWGGWWFWDPVENASFMPWLLATALVHSLAVTEQRGALKAWTLLLAIFGFSLSLLGTFLVRSGVLVSVHAFATDPERGGFILAFLAVAVGGALALFVIRAAQLASTGAFKALSRESLILGNNILLTAAAGTTLVGTLFPLIADAFDLGKVSVGPPYFDAVFVPLMLPLLLVLGIGPLTRWRQDKMARVRKVVMPGLVATVVVAAAVAAWLGGHLLAVLAIALAVWVLAGSVVGVFERLRHAKDASGVRRRLGAGFVGMTIAHTGVAAFVVGVAMVGASSIERDIRLTPGGSDTLGEYQFTLQSVGEVTGPNYLAVQGRVSVSRDGEPVAALLPEKRRYLSNPQPMTEAGISAGVFRDLHVALGEPHEDGSWTLRLQVKPFIRWIWGGCALMTLGGFIAAADRRYRMRRKKEADAPASADAAAAQPA